MITSTRSEPAVFSATRKSGTWISPAQIPLENVAQSSKDPTQPLDFMLERVVEMSIFVKTRPLLITSFINKCGGIGLGLVPMLLVQRQASPADSAAIMTLVKSAAMVGTFGGGWLCDRVGVKRAVLVAFALNGVGIGLIPFVPSLALLCLFGMVAQTGQAMFPSSARLLVTQLVPPEQQRKSIGWLRSVNNLGQIVAFSISWAFSGLGIAPLLVFDAMTCLAAIAFGGRLIPRQAPLHEAAAARDPDSGEIPRPSRRDWRVLGVAALCVGLYSFQYELYSVGAAAMFEISYGKRGLALFSQVMVINTVLCAALGVYAARFLRRVNYVMPAGLLLTTAGTWLTLILGPRMPWAIYSGAFVLTLGEVVFMAMGSYVLMRLTPSSRRQGSIYGSVLLVQMGLRVLGGAAAFPLVVHGAHPAAFVAALGLAALVCWASIRKELGARLA